jgi:hypothetical protein
LKVSICWYSECAACIEFIAIIIIITTIIIIQKNNNNIDLLLVCSMHMIFIWLLLGIISEIIMVFNSFRVIFSFESSEHNRCTFEFAVRSLIAWPVKCVKQKMKNFSCKCRFHLHCTHQMFSNKLTFFSSELS